MAIEKDPERQQCSPGILESCTPCEITDNENDSLNDRGRKPTSAFHQLGILDRFRAIWIFLAMAVGIFLGTLYLIPDRRWNGGSLLGFPYLLVSIFNACKKSKIRSTVY